MGAEQLEVGLRVDQDVRFAVVFHGLDPDGYQLVFEQFHRCRRSNDPGRSRVVRRRHSHP